MQSWPLTTGGMHKFGTFRSSFFPFVALATELQCHYICDFYLGLKYDREWLLQGSGGEVLTQKKVTVFFFLYVLNLYNLGVCLVFQKI